MFLSVIMAVKDEERYVERTIHAILDQTFTDFEFIIVDDGSDDNTFEILTRYAKTDFRIRLFQRPPLGVSSARNFGLERATGTYVTFMDGDDTLKPQTYAICVGALQTFPCDVLTFSIENVSEDGHHQKSAKPLDDRSYTSLEEYLQDLIDRHVMHIDSACNKIYRRSLLTDHGIRFIEGVQYGEDRLFNYAVIAQSKRIRTLPDALYHYHRRSGGSLSTLPQKNIMGTLMHLHRAKMELVRRIGVETENVKQYRYFDLKVAIRHALENIALHWNRCSRSARRTHCEHLVTTDYPDYFHDKAFRQAALRWRLYYRFVQKRHPCAMALLIRFYRLRIAD